MRIGLDFDGVIANCGKLKADGARELYGLDIQPTNFSKEFVVGAGYLTIEEYRNLQRKVYETPEFISLMEPVGGAFEYVSRLVADGHIVQVITSRSGLVLEVAKAWLLRQGLKLSVVGVGYGRSKAEAALGLDVYIDDDFQKLEQLVGVVPHRFLFSWGYNAGLDVGTLARRVASWREFYEAISLLKNAL